MLNKIPGEKKCEVCECMFVNKDDAEATRCKGCAGIEANIAGPNEKYIYQDIKRSDVERKINMCLEKLDAILKILKSEEKKQPEYSKKCESCGSVFVSDKPATRYCDSCKEAKK